MKQCEYCDCGKAIMKNNGKKILWIENGYIYVCRRGNTAYFHKIKVCPMCGRTDGKYMKEINSL